MKGHVLAKNYIFNYLEFKGLGTWAVVTSFPLGLLGDPYPTNKLFRVYFFKKNKGRG